MLCLFSRHSFMKHFSLIKTSTSIFVKGPSHIGQLHSSASLWKQLVQFRLSDIGEGIREVTIKEWFVKPGDQVAQFDSICEVQSDKAAVTITSRYDGVIKKLYYDVDDTGHVGQPLVDIEVEEAESVQSDSEDFDEGGETAASTGSKQSAGAGAGGRALATPAVRRLAAEHHIDLSKVAGTGKDGRVLKEDVLAFIASSAKAQEPTKPAATTSAPPSAPASAATPSAPASAATPSAPVSAPISVSTSDRKVAIRGVQRAMYQSMTRAAQIPHFTYSDEVDLTRLFQWRKRLNQAPEVASSGGGLTFMPFFLKAMSLALREQPVLNAHLVDDDHLLIKASHNIGVAVDSPSGLVVPCIHSIEQLSILEISNALRGLVEAGRSGKLAPNQLTGGTISLSNIGNIGGTYTKPVILPPQVCIGAVGRARPLPRVDANGSVTAAQIMSVSWSADHRVIDGATVARFSNRWKQLLEHPEHFLLHLK